MERPELKQIFEGKEYDSEAEILDDPEAMDKRRCKRHGLIKRREAHPKDNKKGQSLHRVIRGAMAGKKGIKKKLERPLAPSAKLKGAIKQVMNDNVKKNLKVK